ncbi:CPBP family intramembrane glutamic endopeptidase [Microbacterium sp.]|uniref:CPBP family intramembrane glutamic endopeptidase n=1 Tax=Microbacterium sp. TaxID=51671 RepID=UPI003F6F98D4
MSTEHTSLHPDDRDTDDASSVSLPDRPFGVHFRVPRWKSLIVLIAIPATLFLVQIIVFQGVYAIEGPPVPNETALTPLAIAATGISTAITAVLMTILVAAMAKVSWRAVFRHNRAFDWRRVGIYLLGSAVLVVLAIVATVLIAPASMGWGTFAISATTIAVILVSLIAIPLQSAGEEIVFRGVLVPTAGSWFRDIRLAVVFGILLSGVLFAAVHVTLDPWLVSYLIVFSASMTVMGLLSGGLEAAMALHVANNLILGVVNALFAGGGSTTVDRGVGAGPGAGVLILMVMNLAAVTMVWFVERTKRLRKQAQVSALKARQ